MGGSFVTDMEAQGRTENGAVDAFEAFRPMLLGLAYRMLGSRSDAEDVLQDAYLKWRGAADVRDDKAFLTTCVTRLCIDHLRSARVRREEYVGTWLPEPLMETERSAEDGAELADSLSMAFLVVLERLAPRERAAFLLREVFGYPYGELAGILGVSEDNARQLVHRSTKQVRSQRRRFDADARKQRALTERFLVACGTGEVGPLMEILAEDAVLYADGGGRVRAARRPILGAAKIARFLAGIVREAPDGLSSRFETINAGPGILLEVGGDTYGVITVESADDKVQTVNILLNPEKLPRS